MPTDIFDQYLTRLTRRGRNPGTLYIFGNVVRRFREWCANEGIDPLTAQPDDLERYFAEQELAPNTLRSHLTWIRASYKYAHGRGVIPLDPTIDVDVPKPAQVRPRVIPIEYLRTAKENISEEDQWMLFHLAAYTGARQSEITTLRWQDVSLRDETIEIIGKGDKRRLVPIHPALGEVLSEHHKGRGWVWPGRSNNGHPAATSTLQNRLQRIVPTYTFHDFRRTVASSLDANGVEESVINEIMGWAKQGVFARYYRNVAPERLQQAILKLYANDPL